MITFYPGPSKLHEDASRFMLEAATKGITSLNHRSSEFIQVNRHTCEVIKSKLHVPTDYSIAFVSSATECWEIIAQSLVKSKVKHVYNGAFGEKWAMVSKKTLGTEHIIEWEAGLSKESLLNSLQNESCDTLCLTHSETSNGTFLPESILSLARNNHPDSLICIDATSSMGGLSFDWTNADLWFASVQKCFGLPPGMAVLVYNKKVIKRANHLGERKHYNDFQIIDENAQKHQTIHTPNTLNIFLLGKTLEVSADIIDTHSRILNQFADWKNFLSSIESLKFLCKDDDIMSPTVIALEASESKIDFLKTKSRETNIMLGNGYGKWLNKSFRLSNFPAIEQFEIETLKLFLKEFLPQS